MECKYLAINHINYKQSVNIENAIDETGHGRYNWYLLVSCCILNIGATLDIMGFNVIIPAASCDLNLTLAQSGLLMSISQAGFLTALPWSYVADTRGRKSTILLSGAIGFIISVISSFSTSFYMMVVLKLLASTFSATSLTLSAVFLGENTCMKYRTRYLFILNVAHFSSDFICFVMAFLILPLDFKISVPLLVTYRPWRLLSLVLSIPIAIGTLPICFFQESPKFLAGQAQTDKAIEVLKKIHKINNGKHKIYTVKSLKTQTVIENKSFWDSVVKQVVPIFQLPLLWRTLQLLSLLTICVTVSNVFYTWFPAMMNSFFTSTNVNTNFCQKIIANITPTIENDVCLENGSMDTIYSGMIYTFLFTILNIAAVAFANCRMVLIIGACVISGISCIIVDMVHNAIASIVLFFTIQTVGVTFGCVQSYFIDVYPTSHRSLATSLGWMVANFASLVGVSVMGVLVIVDCRITFYGWAAFTFCGILLAIFLPRSATTAEVTEGERY